jgi:hypothetical protein
MAATTPLAARIDPLTVQAAYYLATGLWPVVHLRSFMALTGPKHDTWLVQTFGVLVFGIGASLALGRSDRRLSAMLGSTCALGLALCEIVFVARRRIRPIYLADAALELAFAAAIVRGRSAATRSDPP